MEEELTKQSAIAALRGEYSAIKRLLKQSGDWDAALRALQKGKVAVGDSETIHPPDPEQSWEKLDKLGVRFLSRNHPKFPEALKSIPRPPFGIYVRGEIPNNPCVSIVGTRKATPPGKQFAELLGEQLAAAGIVVISGLAFGIDSAAHRGALKSGKTAAVLVGGAEKASPPSQRNLGKRILQKGAFLSEYPPNSPVQRRHFLARNRIISALSLGTVVVEAPEKSGSLNTAEYARKQGRDIFAVPGPHNHKNYAGNHRLIRAGATLVAKPEHILEHYADVIAPQGKLPLAEQLGKEEQEIVAVLRNAVEGLDKDEILRNTSFDPPQLTQLLSMLTLDGHIVEDSGRYYLR